jgi:phage tail P2-like protein
MSEAASLLPSNATKQERDIEAAIQRGTSLNPAAITQQWNPDTCPESLLPWLAWALNVDEWDSSWPDQFKRQTIADSIEVHRRKGTLSSIRRVLRNAGYGDATIVEGVSSADYDGTFTHNGFITHGQSSDWAEYRVLLSRPMTNKQAAQVRRILGFTAPARCDLVEIIYTEASNIYNGAIRYDGNFNHGTA